MGLTTGNESDLAAYRDALRAPGGPTREQVDACSHAMGRMGVTTAEYKLHLLLVHLDLAAVEVARDRERVAARLAALCEQRQKVARLVGRFDAAAADAREKLRVHGPAAGDAYTRGARERLDGLNAELPEAERLLREATDELGDTIEVRDRLRGVVEDALRLRRRYSWLLGALSAEQERAVELGGELLDRAPLEVSR